MKTSDLFIVAALVGVGYVALRVALAKSGGDARAMNALYTVPAWAPGTVVPGTAILDRWGT